MTIEDIARPLAGIGASIGASIAFYALIWHRDAPPGNSLSDKQTWQEWHDSQRIIDMPRPRSLANKLTALIGFIIAIIGAIAVGVLQNYR